MTNWLHFLIGCLVGGVGGVFLMCLMAIARDDTGGCTRDCNQGRQCDCDELRRKFESET